MKYLDAILTDIPKDSCMARTVATEFRVIFEGAMPGGQVALTAERVDKDSVRIGDQIWMSHNLQMPADPDNGIFVENGQTYFTWHAAMKAAASYGNGWRLPSRKDWARLTEFCGGSRHAGLYLKSKTGWQPDCGLDKYGFNAIPTGYYDTPYATVRHTDRFTSFWSSSTLAKPCPVNHYKPVYYRTLYGEELSFPESYGGPNSGCSVRLVKDA